LGALHTQTPLPFSLLAIYPRRPARPRRITHASWQQR
jgi:hypothetical protein